MQPCATPPYSPAVTMRCSVVLAASIGLLVVACASPRVEAYDNGLGAFPPLGWSTWYVEQRRAIFALTSKLHRADPLAVPSHRCTDDLCGLIDKCTQQEIQSIADAFVSTGMHDLGYEWLVLDVRSNGRCCRAREAIIC